MAKQSLRQTYPDLAKEWHPTKNGNLTPSEFSPHSGKKVWWKCPVADDHEWEAEINSRTKGRGCPCCSGHKVVLSNCLATTHPDFAKEWHPTKNDTLTPYDVIAGSRQRVWWKCLVADDHEWESAVSTRTRAGCPCCSRRKAVSSNCLATTHPDFAKEWHPTKNGTLTPYDVTAGSHQKVWWQCLVADDHEWEAKIDSRIRQNSGCLCCCSKKAVLSNCLATTHPDLIKEWHPTKNGTLTSYDVTAGSNQAIWWKCPVADDHEWEAAVSTRTKGHGCSCCSGRKAVLSNCLATTHPDLVKEWHPTKNGTLTPYDVTAGSNQKVWWKCLAADDHEWEAVVSNKRNCPCCCGQKAVLSNCLATMHPDLVKEWHPTKNGTLTPCDVTAGSNQKVWWICDKNHCWKATVCGRTNRMSGCPKCSSSKGEKKIYNWIVENLEFIPKTQFRFKKKRARFDVAATNVLIEYQGKQHYSPFSFGSRKKHAKHQNLIENIVRDHNKLQFCLKNKLPLLIIPYWDFDRIDEILEDVFIKKIDPTFSDAPEEVQKAKPLRDRIRQQYKLPAETLFGYFNSKISQGV